MRSLLRNRYFDGTKWILQCYYLKGNHHCVLSPNHCQRFQYALRTMVVASPNEQQNKPKREKAFKKEKKQSKRSSRETPDHYVNWRTGNIEVAQVQPEPPSVSEERSLSPWLRQLWRGGSSNSSSSISNSSSSSSSTGSSDDDGVTTNTVLSSMIATSEPYALATPKLRERKNLLKEHELIDFDTFVDDDELSNSVSQKPKRTGGSGNNFDGKGYDGLGGGSAGDDDDDDDDTPNEDDFLDHIDRFSDREKNGSDPRDSWPIDPNLYPHIRASLTDVEYADDKELVSRDTGLSMCTLGTSAGGSCRLRSNSATLVRSGGTCYLVDAGEGVHRQFMISRLRYNDIMKIFITHMHADHIFGLASILLSIQMARLNDPTPRSIEIYGPVGLYNYIAMTLSLTCTEVRKMKIYVYELHGGTQRSMRFSGNRKAYPEFQHKVSCCHILLTRYHP
jgi:Metallo-beta-lactamase superfamily